MSYRGILGNEVTREAAAGAGGSSLQRKSQVALVSFAVLLAAIGVIMAAYLAYENLHQKSGVCTITHGCATVQQSTYGKILGVPVSVPGLGMYAILLVAALAWLRDFRGWRPWATLVGFYGALFGFLFSGYLTYIEAFVLDAWCIYCIVSASLMTLLMLTWLALLGFAARARRLEG